MRRRGRPPHPDILTPRQWEVLEFLRQGLPDQIIAERLGITLAGAKYHVSEILTKLNVSSREEAARWDRELAVAGPSWWTRALGLSIAAKAAAVTVACITVAGLGALAWGVARNGSGDDTPSESEAVFESPGESDPVVGSGTATVTPVPGQVLSCGEWADPGSDFRTSLEERYGEMLDCARYDNVWVATTEGIDGGHGAIAFYSCELTRTDCDAPPLLNWGYVAVPYTGGATVLDHPQPMQLLIENGGHQLTLSLETGRFANQAGDPGGSATFAEVDLPDPVTEPKLTREQVLLRIGETSFAYSGAIPVGVTLDTTTLAVAYENSTDPDGIIRRGGHPDDTAWVARVRFIDTNWFDPDGTGVSCRERIFFFPDHAPEATHEQISVSNYPGEVLEDSECEFAYSDDIAILQASSGRNYDTGPWEGLPSEITVQHGSFDDMRDAAADALGYNPNVEASAPDAEVWLVTFGGRFHESGRPTPVAGATRAPVPTAPPACLPAVTLLQPPNAVLIATEPAKVACD